MTWLTTTEVADELSVSRTTVLRWIKAGMLDAVKLSRATVRIRRSSFDEFVHDGAMGHELRDMP